MGHAPPHTPLVGREVCVVGREVCVWWDMWWGMPHHTHRWEERCVWWDKRCLWWDMWWGMPHHTELCGGTRVVCVVGREVFVVGHVVGHAPLHTPVWWDEKSACGSTRGMCVVGHVVWWAMPHHTVWWDMWCGGACPTTNTAHATRHTRHKTEGNKHMKFPKNKRDKKKGGGMTHHTHCAPHHTLLHRLTIDSCICVT